MATSLRSLLVPTTCLTAMFLLLLNHTKDQPIDSEIKVLEMRLPGALVSKSDVMLCHAIQLDTKETIYLTGFEPLINSSIAHHATLSACNNSGSQDEIWNCGSTEELAYSRGRICSEASYPPKPLMWALDGKGFMFPPGVGFPVGAGTNFHSLVLRIHYNYNQPSNVTFNDTSGFKIFFTTTKPKKLMGALALIGGGQFPPNKTEYSEIACYVPIAPTERLHIFAYRVHTHDIGVMVSGYRIRNSTWTEIGRRSPQLPQSFIPTDVVISGSDIIAVRCTMFNFRSHVVNVGERHEDEMCVFRTMYYTESGSFIPQLLCVGSGPPRYYWTLDKNMDLQHAPADVVHYATLSPT